MAKKETTKMKEKEESLQKGRKERNIVLESDTFTLSCDAHNWIAEVNGKTIYHSRLRHLCIALLEHKLKKAEVRGIQELKDAIEKATNEIVFHIPNAVR